jgi:hypothetical protein
VREKGIGKRRWRRRGGGEDEKCEREEVADIDEDGRGRG